jgi:hypothetical protein
VVALTHRLWAKAEAAYHRNGTHGLPARGAQARSRELDVTDVSWPTNVGDVEFTDAVR